jgi:hypothetical protein
MVEDGFYLIKYIISRSDPDSDIVVKIPYPARRP